MRSRAVAMILTIASVLFGAVVPGAALEVGDKAPDFTLPATTQEKLGLSQLVGKKNVVLFGFIGAFTPT
jgi:peroxiredoxin